MPDEVRFGVGDPRAALEGGGRVTDVRPPWQVEQLHVRVTEPALDVGVDGVASTLALRGFSV